MVKIENFSGVLEIAFGMNALFYVFEFIPYTEERLRKLLEENGRLAKEKIELTKNHEVYPIGFVVGSLHYGQMFILRIVTILTSLIVLGILLYSSFSPDAKLPTVIMCLLLIFAFGVPLAAFWLYSRNVKFVEAANKLLEQQISEARHKNTQATNPKGS